MHKKVLYSLIGLLFFWLEAKTQVTQPCPNPPPPGGSACNTTCVYCDFDDYSGTSGGTPSSNMLVCGQIVIHNDQWLGFVATSTSMEIVTTTSNCAQGEGVQVAFFDACNATDAVACNPGIDNGAGIPLVLSYDQFVPGQTYYLMIDGSFGDVCDFTVDITQGSVTPPPPGIPDQPTGPTELCPGATAVYTIPPVDGTAWYRWTGPAGSRINGTNSNTLQVPAPQGTTVTITFGNTPLNGNVCVGAGNACFAPNTACLPVHLTLLAPTIKPDLILCYEDRVFTNPESPYTTTSLPVGITNLTAHYLSYLGCDSTVRQKITVLPQNIKNLGTKYICQGTCFVLNGTSYCNQGTQQQPLVYDNTCDTILTFNVIIVPSVANIPAVPQINCAMPSLTLNSTGSTTSSGATFRWTNATWTTLGSGTTQTVTGPGMYNLIVTTSVSGTTCRDTATVNVTSSAAFPGATAVGGTITCNTPTVTLQGSSPTPGVNYQWAGPCITPANQFLQNPTVSCGGTYTLSVTNPITGCTSIATTAVIANDTLPTATAVGGTITCLQPSVTIDGSSNVATATYNWSGPGINAGNQHQENPVVTVAGTYTVTVTNPANGCSQTATTTVIPNNSPPVANAGTDQTINCQTLSVILNGSASGGAGPFQFTWTGPGITPANQNQQTPTVSTGGSYTLTVLNSNNGCSGTDVVQVTQLTTPPTASAGADALLNCNILTVTLNGSASSQGANLSASWSGPGINAGNQNLYSPQVTLPGTYTITVTNSVSLCTATDNVVVTQDIVSPTVNAGVDQILTCSSPNGVTLNGTGGPAGITFLWTGADIDATNQALPNPNVNLPGTYTLVVTNPVNHCTATDQVVISQDANAPVAAAGADQVLNCTVSSVVIGGATTSTGPGISYVWTGPGITGANQNQAMPSISTAGTYIIVVNNSTNGCSTSDTTVITSQVMLPVALAGNDSTLNCTVLNVTLNGSGSSQGADFTAIWTGAGINAGNQNSYTPQVTLPGVYTLTITNTVNHCTATDNVTILQDIAVPTANAGTDEILTCTTPNGIPLNGSGSPATITFLWTGPGITPANAMLPNPTINDPGTYVLVVTNTVNHCSSTDQVVISEDASVPTANAGSDLVLNCGVSSVNIDGSASSTGVDIVYTWTGPGISGANGTAQNPQNITLPGTYNLTVTNNLNSCTNTDVVVIAIDTISPVSVAGNDLTLNCFNSHADTLDATGSSTGAGFTLLWSGPAINAANQNLIRPVVNQSGTYTVLITNTTNLCTSSSDALVVSDTLAPVADAGLDQTIDCANSSVPIGGNSSSGSNFEYLWSGPDINTGNEALATLSVSMDGTYQLEVTNTVNGCVTINDVLVSEDLAYPVASAGADATLTCAQDTIALDGSASSSGAGIQILWSGQSITPANESSATPDVDSPDTYILTVTNTVNSCVSKDTVIILEDKAFPVAAAGPDGILNCQTTSIMLNGSGSSAGMDYLWTGQDITPANETQQSPSVSAPGNYALVVTNPANGCSAVDDVEIDEDVALPIADAGTDLVLDCQTPAQAIDGSNSSTGLNIEYLWQGAGINSGNFNDMSPMVSDSGTYVVTVTNIDNHCTASDVVFVGLNADLPVTSAGSDQTLNCAVDTLQLDGALSQAGPNILYAWSGPGIVSGETTQNSPNVFEPGNYSLTVTNTANGCSNTDEVTVLEDVVEPFVVAGDDQTLTCANSTTGVTLSSAGSSSGAEFTILWSGSGITSANDTVANPVVTGVGPYTLTIVNTLNGCSKTDDVIVLQDQNLPVSVAGEDQLITCAVTQVLLDGSGSTSPSGQLEYTWSGQGVPTGSEHAASITVSVSGNYTLTIVNPVSGCQSTDNVVVDQDTNPPVVSAEGDTITCQNPTGTLTVSSSDPASLYEWQGAGITPNNATADTLDVNQPGPYNVTVTASNGCTAEASTVMNVDANFPLGAAEGDELNCLNNGVGSISGSVTTPGATFFWSGPNGFNATTETVEITTAGTYIFNVVANNGCTNPISVTVAANFTQPTVAASVPGDLNCTTTSLSISGAGTSTGNTFTYGWTTTGGNIVSGDNTLSPVVDAPGTYTLLVTNTLNGCTNTQSIVVANDPNVPTAIDLTVRDIKCFGDINGVIAVSAVNGGVEPFVYSLNGATASAVDQFSNLAAGEYTLSLEDANGCLLDTLITISEPGELSVELGEDLTVHLGDSVTVQAVIMNETPVAKVDWNLSPNRDSAECCSFSYQPLQTYRHVITVQDSNGCKASDVLNVTVRRERQVFIPNIFDLNSDDPLKSVLMIHGGNDVVKIHKWLIFDRWGDAVFEVRDFLPNDPSKAWDGTVRGKKGNPAVFIWTAEIEFIDGQTEMFEGDVTIMR
ncbi:MAG TPA: hypothetical protein PLO67_03945 [Saprospiraceae bacterium]|nr:hypothetical protein [Saprospiraceae bacterium]